MQYIGDIELINGKIINLKVDPIIDLPIFSEDDEGRLIYNITDKSLYFNNGTSYSPLQVASQTSYPLVQSLGNIWLNSDFSFNPTPFNNLPILSGLSANDSLFSVISQLTNSIDSLSNVNIDSIDGVIVNNLQQGDILYYDGTEFINVPVDNIPGFSINLSLGQLENVVVPQSPTSNESLFFNSSTNRYESTKWTYRYDNATTQTTHTVVHNLGVKYGSVTVINTLTDTVVTPTSIIFDSTNQLTVTVSPSLPVIIIFSVIPIV